MSRDPRARKVGAAIHSVRAVPADQIATVVEWAQGQPLHFHLSEQRAENEACLAAHGCTPDAAARRARRARPELDRRPRHPPHAPTTSALLHETTICMCPTTERDLADGIGRAGPRLCLGSDSHAVIDLFEEARAVELDLRLATERRGHFTAADAAARRDQPRQPRLARRRPDRAGRARRPRHGRPRLGLACETAEPDTMLESIVFAATAADVRSVIVGGHAVLIDNIGTLVTNDPELGDGPLG